MKDIFVRKIRYDAMPIEDVLKVFAKEGYSMVVIDQRPAPQHTIEVTIQYTKL